MEAELETVFLQEEEKRQVPECRWSEMAATVGKKGVEVREEGKRRVAQANAVVGSASEAAVAPPPATRASPVEMGR